jgi:hypothetical protein
MQLRTAVTGKQRVPYPTGQPNPPTPSFRPGGPRVGPLVVDRRLPQPRGVVATRANVDPLWAKSTAHSTGLAEGTAYILISPAPCTFLDASSPVA